MKVLKIVDAPAYRIKFATQQIPLDLEHVSVSLVKLNFLSSNYIFPVLVYAICFKGYVVSYLSDPLVAFTD